MKKTLAHFLMAAIGVLLASIPAILASPVTTNFVKAHPAYAAYFPIITGLFAALLHVAHAQTQTPKA